MRLALGTAQFGLPYGVANRSGQLALDEARSVLYAAANAGMDTLDTAIAYGDSEAVLGAIGVDRFRVVTKLPACPEDTADPEVWVRDQIDASLRRLRVPAVHAVLLHRPMQLTGTKGAALAQAMRDAQADGLVGKVGVSVYGPAELEAIQAILEPSIVQAPFNLIDRRFAASGWLQRLHEAGVEVHVRSVFMQGLLLLPRAEIPAKFAPWAPLWDAWDAWLDRTGIPAVQACIGFAQSFPYIDRLVVGVDDVRQLKQLVAATEGCVADWPMIESSDERLVNPSLWSSL